MVCSRYPKEYRYYETILKRKCFRKLRNNVWENKTKLTLIKKADYHYRIKLLYKCINLWVAYVNKRYKKKINRRLTDVFYNRKLKAKGFWALKKNVEKTWLLMRICGRRFEWNLKFRVWHQWKHYAEKRLKVREVKLLADRIREERLRIRLFYLWLFRLNEKRSLQNICRSAVERYKTKLKAKYFKVWKIFASRQICKKKIEKLAVTCYEDKLIEKYTRCWKKYTFQKKSYKYQMNIITNFYENYLIKNYLSQWLATYKEYKFQKKTSKYNFAVNFYETNLLVKSFHTLWKARETKKRREEKMQTFREIRTNIYLSFYIKLWMEKRTEKILLNILENKAIKWREGYLRELFLSKILEKYEERIEEREEVEKIIRYYNAIVIHRAFRGWCEVINKKKNKKIILENSWKFYEQKITRKSFEKWKKFVFRKRRKKMAVEYGRFILLSRVLDQWKIFLKERKQKKVEACSLKRKHQKRLLERAFSSWKKETETSVVKLNAAVDFCYKSKLSKAFYTWKKSIRINSINKRRCNQNKTILNEIIIKDIIFRWYEVYSVKRNIKKKIEAFNRIQDKRLLGCYFKIWYKFVEKMKNLQQSGQVYPQLKSNLLIEQYLIQLVFALTSKKIFNRKNELAKKAEEKMLKRRYIKKWLCFIHWKKERILRCLSEERKFESKDALEIFLPAGKGTRRKPMIPGYLKVNFITEHSEDEDLVNQETFRVEKPVNKKLPVVSQNPTFASFEI